MDKVTSSFIAMIVFVVVIAFTSVISELHMLRNEVGNLYNRLTEIEKEIRPH